MPSSYVSGRTVGSVAAPRPRRKEIELFVISLLPLRNETRSAFTCTRISPLSAAYATRTNSMSEPTGTGLNATSSSPTNAAVAVAIRREPTDLERAPHDVAAEHESVHVAVGRLLDVELSLTVSAIGTTRPPPSPPLRQSRAPPRRRPEDEVERRRRQLPPPRAPPRRLGRPRLAVAADEPVHARGVDVLRVARDHDSEYGPRVLLAPVAVDAQHVSLHLHRRAADVYDGAAQPQVRSHRQRRARLQREAVVGRGHHG